jgi:hypothetical protein
VRKKVLNLQRMYPFTTAVSEILAKQNPTVWDLQMAFGSVLNGDYKSVMGKKLDRSPQSDQFDKQLKFHKMVGRFRPKGV